jgi:osmoprotectant transport system permease protein
MPLIDFWLGHRADMLRMLGEHVVLVVVSVSVAAAIGVPAGILAVRRPRLGRPLVGFANVVQTIPSLALFGFLIPVPLIGGLGARAAVVALILYGLLPIVRTTAAGLATIDRAVIEAGVAMGMTPRQLLLQVELPLALPAMVAGIRVAAVVGVGTATIAAAIGAGGLGELIFRGLSMVDQTVILAGAVPAAVLALTADGCLTWLERRLGAARSRRGRMAPAVALGAVLLLLAVAGAALAWRPPPAVRVGSKNFTEQIILGELLAQTLERKTDLAVERRLNLGGTFICDRGLRSGDIDVYVEYTGTALTAIFGEAPGGGSAAVLDRLRDAYARTGRTVLEPLGFNNTFAMLVRGETARQLGIRTLSEAVSHARGWRAGVGYEFLERADGFRGLAATYDLVFAAPPRVMDLSLIYRALADGQVDLIAGDATSGLIAGLDLVMLDDDRRYFPPYHAVPVASTQTLLRHPEMGAALAALAGRVSERDMRTMNHAVDVLRRPVPVVVGEFLGVALGAHGGG